MTYNLQSLITILDQILNPEQEHWILDDHNTPQLESLLQKSVCFKQILENSSAPNIESLESRIRDAAHKAEDLIEFHMVDQMLTHKGTRLTFVTPDLREVTQELDSAMEKVVELMEQKKMSTSSSSSDVTFLPDPTSKNVVVGVDKDLLQLKDRLTGMQSEQLEIVPIVGMGGIGKTTIARKLYNDPLIVSHFDICAWTTISQVHNVRAILFGLLRRPNEKLSNELIACKDNELIDILHKRLYFRRYMIVLDDIWRTECWDDIKWYFPDNNNGSRIVLTTREAHVARYVGTVGWQHEVQLLEESDSWNLLQQTVFDEENCPYNLREIGRKIARDCGGLALAINVIGGVLSKAERARDVWEHVANDVRETIAETNNHEFSNVLSLSYNHLPNHLRPCFFYMGAFPEDYEIKASRLKHLLVAEGFLKSTGDKSLEEEAEDSLSALVDRNLLLVTRKKLNGKAHKYGMHDLLREVCIRKADEEKFLLHVKNGSEVRCDKLRRVSVETSCGMNDVYAHAPEELLSVARSFICAAPMLCQKPSLFFSMFRLVRVLDVYEVECPEFPREIYQLVNLRYLAVSCKSGGIPTGISTLCYLQTLIARVDSWFMPSEIWEMSELRHLKLNTIIYIEEGDMIKFIRNKLHKLSEGVVITASLMRMGFFESIPNIKNLGVYFPELPSTTEVVDLRHLHELRTLRCNFVLNEDAGGFRFPLQKLRFPSSLRKLTLSYFVISGRVMTTLCALPNLEVLKIGGCVFEEGYMIKFVRKKLQTLCFVYVTPSLMRRGFFESIPNIKYLGVVFGDELASSSEVVDLTHLHKLQTLRFASQAGCRFLLIFPSSLRKLSLVNFVIFGRFMRTLCALPNLEVLKIGRCVFEDNEEWEAAEGDEFRSLQFLQLQRLKLVRWRADETNFPTLRQLHIGYCHDLEEIPSGVGEIPTLQLIQLYKCNSSAVASAKQIQEQQQSEFDNYHLKLELYDD